MRLVPPHRYGVRPTRDLAWASAALIWVDDAVVAAWAGSWAVGRARRPIARSSDIRRMRAARREAVTVRMGTWFLRGWNRRVADWPTWPRGSPRGGRRHGRPQGGGPAWG